MITYGAKTPSERFFCTMDMSDRLDGSDLNTIGTSVVVLAGEDANPSAILDGAPQSEGMIIGQWVIGGLDGVTYMISFTATGANQETAEGQAALPVAIQY